MGQDMDRKRANDRERLRRKRADMTPVDRAEARREHDAAYRARHRAERAEADRKRRQQ